MLDCDGQDVRSYNTAAVNKVLIFIDLSFYNKRCKTLQYTHNNAKNANCIRHHCDRIEGRKMCHI